MATEIKIPRVGMAVADATIIEWTAKEGDRVEERQVVVVIETEKVRADVESPGAGFLHIILKEGEAAPAGAVIGLLAATREELKALQKESPEAVPAKAAKAEAALPREAIPVGKGEERIRISPVARKLAEEHAVDITRVAGTGPEGRITREDIEKAIAAKEAAPAAPPAEVPGERKAKTIIPLKGMRGAIAEHMHRSLSVAAQLTTMGEIDMTGMVKLRNNFVAQENTLGVRITYTDMLVFAIARVLRDHPMLNSSIIDNEIKVWQDINIGVATALDAGLIVPVVRNADQKSLVEISKEIKALTEKAKERKLKPEEVSGGTFTLTNHGISGSLFATPIINQPQCAILGVGAVQKRVVAVEAAAPAGGVQDVIAIRPMVYLTLTFDHRILDGALADRFLGHMVKTLEGWG